jgi:hypothetical protein
MADLPGVELARPGTWPLSTGKTEFTPEHLRDAADFFTATGGQSVPLKLGHVDSRFDGEPSFGSLTNIRYDEDDRGPVLLGDLTGMPAWLAAAAPERWPNRSVEGWSNFDYDGRTYRLVVTSLALLGVAPPAVRTIRSLRDLKVALAASGAVHIIATSPEATVDPTPAPPADPAPTDPPAAPSSVTLDADVWAETQGELEQLRASAAAQANADRDRVIAAAINEGRFAPARRDHFRRLWDADPEGTRQTIAGLTPNTIPVMASGYDGDGDGERDLDDEFAGLFPPKGRR